MFLAKNRIFPRKEAEALNLENRCHVYNFNLSKLQGRNLYSTG